MRENVVHVEIGLILLSPECTPSFLNEGDAKLCFLMPLLPLCSIKAPCLSLSWENIYFSHKSLGYVTLSHNVMVSPLQKDTQRHMAISKNGTFRQSGRKQETQQKHFCRSVQLQK